MPCSFDKKIIAKNFSNSAPNYDDFALVQKSAATDLLDFTKAFIENKKGNLKILDLGSGTSFLAKELLKSYDKKIDFICEIDLAKNMLANWKERPAKVLAIQADIENLPFRNDSFDLIISSFSLQWLNDFDHSFSCLYKILRKDGILSFCLPNAQSLAEIKIASQKSKCNFHFNDLPKDVEIKNVLTKNNFTQILFNKKSITQNFSDGIKALKSLKSFGGSYSANNRFIGKKNLQNFQNFYLKNSINDGNNFPLSWAVSYHIFGK